LVKFTDEKIDLSYKITEILNEVVDGRSDFSSSESKSFRDLVQINESNQKNNKINGAIIAGLISSNKILLSAITGSTISEVYGQSGRMPSNNGNKNLAKA
jgi:flagellar biosynthesis/type III secretory pathway chaperone